MIDEAEDEYGGDEPSPTRADWAAMRERVLAQRRDSMWLDAYECSYWAHHIGKHIPDCIEHPLYLATIRGHWLNKEVDPEDLRNDLPAVARDVKKRLEQHDWTRTNVAGFAPISRDQGQALAAVLVSLRGYRRSGR